MKGDCRKNQLRIRVERVLRSINVAIKIGGLLSLLLVGIGIYGFIASYDSEKSWSEFFKQVPSSILLYGVTAGGVPVGGWLWIRLLRMKYGFLLEDTAGNCDTHSTPTPACEKHITSLENLLQSPMKM